MLKTLHENDVKTYAPIAVVDWTNEEGARFPPAMLGSGVWAGVIKEDYAYVVCVSFLFFGLFIGWGRLFCRYAVQDLNAPRTTLHSELARIGFVGPTPASYTANPLSAHFEVHIEQGPILEEEKKTIGVVTGVQGKSHSTIPFIFDIWCTSDV